MPRPPPQQVPGKGHSLEPLHLGSDPSTRTILNPDGTTSKCKYEDPAQTSEASLGWTLGVPNEERDPGRASHGTDKMPRPPGWPCSSMGALGSQPLEAAMGSLISKSQRGPGRTWVVCQRLGSSPLHHPSRPTVRHASPAPPALQRSHLQCWGLANPVKTGRTG